MRNRGIGGLFTGPGLGILAIACLLASVTPAFGGVAGTIKVLVTPISPSGIANDPEPNATYTDPATNFKGNIGYRVDIKNEGKNTSNDVRFRAETYVTDPAELGTYAFDSSSGAVCSPTANPPPGRIQIQCNLGTLRSGQVVPTFYVFFKTPQKVINGNFDGPGTDFVNLFHEVLYAEGRNGPNSNPQNGFTPLTQALPDFVLGTLDPKLVRSVVLTSGGSFATGNNGVANNTPLTDPLSDQFAVKSVVPPLNGAAFTTLQIEESSANCSPISPNIKTCYGASFTIPGTFAFLTNTFSMAIENVKYVWVCPSVTAAPKMMKATLVPVTYNCRYQPAPIERIQFVYVPDGSANTFAVNACAQAGVPNPPVNGQDVPCINARTVVKDANNKPIRYEWAFISVKNGRLTSTR